MYKKQGSVCSEGYWLKPYGYCSYFSSRNEYQNYVTVLFYLNNEDKEKLNYKDIADFAIDFIIPKIIDGLEWNGLL